MLTGVSTDYYIRLEQGRERRPSDQVLGALAQVLELDQEATAYLHELVHPRPSRHRAAGRVDQVHPNVLRLMDRWGNVPSFVVNRRLDVLARSPVGAAICGEHQHSDNLMRLTFLAPAARELYLDWEQEASTKVAHLRAVAGADRDDPFLVELVEELSSGSEDFRRLWARHDVRAETHESKRLYHRDVGELTVWVQTFDISAVPGQQLIVALAEPGSPSERALALLGARTAGGR